VIRVVYRDESPSKATNGVSNGESGSGDNEVIVKIEKKKFEVEQSLLEPNSGYEHVSNKWRTLRRWG